MIEKKKTPKTPAQPKKGKPLPSGATSKAKKQPIELIAELKEGDVFTCWIEEVDKNGKIKRAPRCPKSGMLVDFTNRKNLHSYETAHEAYMQGKFDGIQRVVFEDDEHTVVDLDTCRDPATGKFKAEATRIISTLRSYTEISPSGTGAHTWIKAKKPGHKCQKALAPGTRIEIYDKAKPITMTGKLIFTHEPFTEVQERQAELDEVYFDLWPEEKEEKPTQEEKTEPLHTLSDEEIIKRAKAAKNGEKFSLLWEGDWEEAGYLSQSEGDLGLVDILTFWTGPDEERIDRLFRDSGLYRPKWDEKRGVKTYGEITLSTALKTATKYYSETSPLKALERNEDGDAELFRNIFEKNLRYDHAEEEWYRWEDHHWRMDVLKNVLRDIEDVIKIYEKEKERVAKLCAEAIAEGDKNAIKKWTRTLNELRGRIRALRTRARKKNVLALAACGPPLGVTGEEWDNHPWLLPCANGVINLRTGDLHDGSREDFIKTVAPTTWEGISEEAPLWKQFLLEVFNRHGKLISYIQRLLGMALVGEVKEHIFPIFWGKGRNGKGTLLETIAHVLGPLAGPVQGEMLLSQNWTRSSAAPSADIMALKGRRLAWASETEEGRELNISKVKWLVGGDTLAGRPPFGKRVIEFKPTHTLFLLTNNKPKATADDYALWDRISLVPFTKSFVDNPKYADEYKADPNLPDKLKLEASGILAWLVRGCLEWQRRGLEPPEFVKMATEKYKAEEDILTMFLEECCTLGKGLKVRAGKIYKDYRYWADGLGYDPWSNAAFGTRMTRRFEKERTNKGIFYLGVTVKDD
jgi:putative DNA primase/helicase